MVDSTHIRRQSAGRGLLLLIVCLLLLDALLPLVHDRFRVNSFWWRSWTEAAITGFLFSQFLLAAVMGGLLGRSWIFGYSLATLVAVLGVAGYLSVEYATYGAGSAHLSFIETFIPLFHMPATILAGSLPFILMRQVRGWRLGAPADLSSLATCRGGIEDLLCLISVAASAHVIARFPITLFEFRIGGIGYIELISLPTILLCYSALFMLPATWLAMRWHSWWRQGLGWLGLLAASLLVFMAINRTMTSATPTITNYARYLLLHLSGAATIVSVLAYVRRIGLTLSSVPGQAPVPVPVPAATASEAGSPGQAVLGAAGSGTSSGGRITLDAGAGAARRGFALRWRIRAVTAVIVGTALCSSLGALLLDRQRQAATAAMHHLAKELRQQQGDLLVRARMPFKLKVPPYCNDATLQKYLCFTGIESLSLARSRVTDDGLKALATLKRLKHLDLSYTRVTDAGLEHLRPLPLESLTVAGTALSLPAIKDFIHSQKLTSLDLGDRPFTDEDLAEFPPVQALGLRRTGVTDEGVRQYLARHQPRVLDLSYTRIDGSGLIDAHCLQSLKLDGTPVTDAHIHKLLSNCPSLSISLRDTQVTMAAIPAAVVGELGLIVANTGISERDLAGARLPRFSHLGLNGQEFSGEFLKSNNLQARVLDLSHSKVTDQSLRHLVGQRFQGLYLAETDISDEALPLLSKMQVLEIDLSGTRVTASGLLRNPLPPTVGVILSAAQCTPEELASLRRYLPVQVDQQRQQDHLHAWLRPHWPW
jgi:internalin A